MEEFVSRFTRKNNGSDEVLYIVPDTDAFNPREEFDTNLWKLYSFSPNYSFGDSHEFATGDIASELFLASLKEKYGTATCDYKEFIDRDDMILFPLMVYDHSGISLSYRSDIYPFNDRWDASFIGFCYIDRDKFISEAGDIPGSPWKKRAIESLDCELSDYTDYINGNCYGYIRCDVSVCPMCHHVEENEVESCFGFYGYDSVKDIAFSDTDNTTCPWTEDK